MTAMPQPSLTPQHTPVSRASLDDMKITLAALRVTMLNLSVDTEAAMQMLAEEIMQLAGAVGAAIALKNSDQIVCRASAGLAPGVGAVLQPGQGLSGECVLTGELVRCEDTDVDARVNPQICRDLGFRSALIVPFMLDGQSIGLVELLAAEPHHFNDDDVLFLNDVAGVVLEANGLSVGSDLIERAISSETDVPVDVKDVVTDLMLALEEQRPESSTVSIMPEITDAVIREQIEFIEKTNAAPVIAKPQLSFAVRSIPVRQVKGSSTRRTITLSVAAALVLAIVGGLWMWNAHRSPTTQPGELQTATASSTAAKNGDAASSTAGNSANNASDASVTGASEASAVTRSVDKPVARNTDATAQRRIATLSPKQGSSVLLGEARSSADPTPAPSIASLGGFPSNAPVLPPVGEPASPVFQPSKISSGLRGGTPIYQPRPNYPEMAKRNGVTGDVVLKFVVTKNGTVTNVRVVSGNPTLALAAIQSVKLWRYRPFLLNSEPTEAESQATIKFTSPR